LDDIHLSEEEQSMDSNSMGTDSKGNYEDDPSALLGIKHNPNSAGEELLLVTGT
jgi:hypothetical protein